MSAPGTINAGYLENLLAGQPHLPASPLAWLNALRAEAVDRVGVLTVPTLRDEEWRFTDISQLTKMSFHPVRTTISLQVADIERFYIEEATTRLVFIDGVYAPQLSSAITDNGVAVVNLEAGFAAHAAAIEPYLGRLTEFRDNVFAALNTAFLLDAALIVVPRDISVAVPVHMLFIATQKDVVSYPRCLLLAESGSAVTVIEDYVSLQEDAYFTNAVTEIALVDNARVNHIRVQREGAKAFHIANCAVSLARASNYQSVSVAFGARISRYNLNVQLAEEAECAVDGLALISGRQLADTHTCIDHAKPHAVSHQMHKCIVGGSAHAVFNGKIMVRQGAQRTDSRQSSRNLLLTNKAHVDTKPQLEIFADDVKCTHGATIGQLDNEEVFYLQSRGLSETAARNMLTYAFGAEIIERIPISSLKCQLEQTVLEQTTIQP
ncbi:Fe-S cluster assembly protein SufD [Candidatus Nitrotoga sp. 1052]|uniref:Fe-S cluster assembly protein SufD n=1 Tax=Candidatus Nitrotoga sp. 1052 TaxID=2886964 RepID=UPI001EF6CF8E|nr:Fe-S cluster assembly protein SufD [Candidatus Nitrotoga sp. 1052]CAH1089938.1 Iron-sulfur cluster assembly protein SufD [Candidatus Nitrotoga sp. 1052]